MGDDDPHYAGHRDRLRERFRKGGHEALPDYELLELVLFRSIPRIDVKPLAKALLKRFGSFADVLAAPPTLLREMAGMGDRAVTDLKIVEASAKRMAQGAIAGRPVLSSWASVLDYCRTAVGFGEREHFRVLFLDKRNSLIADEEQQRGTVDHAPVYPREVVRRALELSATAVVLVHNHPSGDPTPSTADVHMTREIAAAGRPLNVTVHDHIIVGRQGHASLRALKLLDG